MLKYETNSKKVKPGQIFVAIKGHTVDGHDYIEDAIKNGAESLIVEHEVESSIPYTIVPNSEEFLKSEIPKLYSEEVNKLKIIGITGTNGKTTSAYLTYQMLNLLNKNTAYLGTIGYYNKETFIEVGNTTPDIVVLYNILLKAVSDGVEYLVMEISSHALDMGRINGLKLIRAAFTNLTQDHLDYHKNFGNYLNAKVKILDYLDDDNIILLNNDDEASKAFMNHKYLTYGYNADYNIIDFTSHADGTDLTLSINEEALKVHTNLTSKFNVYNYLVMFGLLHSLGFDTKELIENTKNIYPPKGRCETIKAGPGFAVIDYAHTPDAVEKVITAYNELKKGRVITIVGCGGDRDPKKRPIMGKIATSNSDFAILTSDNPRTEDPVKILEEVVKGNTDDNFIVEVDRKKAIHKGLEMLKENDILLILGKGHEDYQIIGHEKIHFDDAEIVREYYK